MSTKPKKLTLSTLNKLDNVLNEKKVVHIMDDQYAVSLDCKFRTTKIQKLSIDYLEYLNQLKKRSEINSDTLMSVSVLLYALVCKYFSDLPVTFGNIDELVDVTNKLLDLGIIEQLFSDENGFDPIEVKKLSNALEKISRNIGQVFGEMAYMSTLNEIVDNEDETGVADGV